MADEQTDELFDFDEATDENYLEAERPEALDADATPNELIDRINDAEDRAIRAQAELENFRRRMRREMEDQRKFSNQGLISDMLPVIDNVYRAISAASKNEASSGMLEGFLMVAQQLISTLNKYECYRIDAVGEVFDPNQHEAISQMPSNEIAQGAVIQVVQEGYKLHERVIRPSQVIVSTGPAPE